MSALQNEQSPKLSFTKASACGNDFLLVEASHAPGDLRALTRRLCDRHNGIGADGVEWLFPDAEADIDARLINADGSAAEISGNGTRCVAAEICAREGKAEVVIRTGAGLKTCQFVRRRGSTFEFEANMGQPEVGGELSIEAASVQARSAQIVSMGNPHYVIFRRRTFPEGWQRQARNDPGAAAVSTRNERGECVKVRGTSNEVEIRLFERGVGRDAVLRHRVLRVRGRRDRQQVAVSSPVTVIAPGGLAERCAGTDGRLSAQGPATLVCRGEFFI
jgi:diaminopimelate epimerase